MAMTDDEIAKMKSDHESALKKSADDHAALKAELDKIKTAPAPKKEDDADLKKKADDQRALDEKKTSDNRALEKAVRFSMGAEGFLKTNESLLPKDVADIFKAAEKEKYDTVVEKDRAITSGIVQAFFSVQSNLDLLTTSQKTALEDYLKLTKTGKEEKAREVYDNIFEPTFEMLKRIKKAEAIGKGGGGTSTDAETAYKNKLIAGSRKHYLGEKTP